MSDSRVMLGVDRLPWLPDEPARARKPSGNLLGWAGGAILLVAGASYWLGQRSASDAPPAAQSSLAEPQATVRLPEASPPASRPADVPPVTMPKIERIVAPPIPIMESPQAQRTPAPVARVRIRPAAAHRRSEAVHPSPPPPEKALAPKTEQLRPWPVRVIDGASGRLVRVGTFRTARQAKKGWWAIVRMNPALKRLPALVVPVQSLRNGRVYYRLQMGTTSQAHSTVLCQRMRMIAQSCVVIDQRGRGGIAL